MTPISAAGQALSFTPFACVRTVRRLAPAKAANANEMAIGDLGVRRPTTFPRTVSLRGNAEPIVVRWP
jgi:hypothetical protein